MDKDPYRWFAKWYDAVLEPANAPLRAIGLKMYPPEPGMAVLDVGCGTGAHLALYAEEGCRAFGIDASPAMVEKARRRLGERAEVRLGDASELPYADGSFDLILVATVLHELAGEVQEAALAEMARTLRPSGRVLAIDYHAGRLRPLRGWLSRALSVGAEIVAGPRHFQSFRAFLAAGGVPGIVESSVLAVERQKIVAGGNIGLFLLSSSSGNR